MKIYINGQKVSTEEKMAFVEVKDGSLLCIGTAKELEGASLEEICQMIREAVAINLFQDLGTENIKH